MAKLPELEYKIQEITDRIRELRTILGISVEEMVYDSGEVLLALLGFLRNQADLAQTILIRTG